MIKILPAVIPTDLETMRKQTARLRFASQLQLDIVDGVFAKPASWPYQPAGEPAEAAFLCEQFAVQVDIMAFNPLTAMAAWSAVGAQAFVLHVETVSDLSEVITYAHKNQLTLWLSGDDKLPVITYKPYLNDIAGVQLMGIDVIGEQGHAPSNRVVDNIRALRDLSDTVAIQIDGSVNQKTIATLHEAGATQFVVGSAISRALDPYLAYRKLVALATC